MDTRKMVHGSTVVRRYLSPDIEVAAAVKRREIMSYGRTSENASREPHSRCAEGRGEITLM